MNKAITKIKEFFTAEKYLNKTIMTAAPMRYIIYLIVKSVGYFAPIFLIYIWKVIIDSLTIAETAFAGISSLMLVIVVYLSLTLIEAIAGFLSENILYPYINDKVTYYLDILIMEKMSGIDTAFYDNPENRNLFEVVQTCRNKIIHNIDYLCNTFFMAIAFISALIMFCSYNFLFAVIFCVTCFPGAYFEYKSQKAMDMFSIDYIPKHREKNYLRLLMLGDESAQELRIYNLADYFRSKCNGLWNEIRVERAELFKKGTYKVFFASVLENVSLIMIIILSVFSVKDGNMSVGTLSLFIGFTATIKSHISYLFSAIPFHLNRTVPFILQFIEFIEKTYDFENTYIAPKNKTEKIEPFPEIEFRNVSFKYPNSDSYAVKNLSFKIERKEKIALVGVNGAGKSTIIKLMLRFYEPESGEIFIGGRNIKSIKQSELYPVFGVCFQSITKYALTAKENIVLSSLKDGDNNEKFKEASRSSGADGIFEKFPQGYETELTRQFSSEGYEPSLGQWQKIAIARALFRGADITILDEPSSALDPEAEDFLFKSFAKHCGNKGAVLVSHRLSSVFMADRVFLMEKGTLLESGTHDELMRLNGRYAELYRMQAEKYLKDGAGRDK